jgi:signal transduction histidine kinase
MGTLDGRSLRLVPSKLALGSAWADLSLVRKFTLVTSFMLLTGMVLIGAWGSGRIEQELVDFARQTWLLAAAVMLATMALQFDIVRRGSRTIDAQRLALEQGVDKLSRSLQQNEELRSQLDVARRSSIELNEAFMRRVGADLHDGPAQLIGMSILMLEPTTEKRSRRQERAGPGMSVDDIETVRTTLIDALNEIRQLSAGLILPELQDMPLASALQMAANAHVRRRQLPVKCEIGELPAAVTPLMKTTLYRVVQEGLNNAYNHGGGKDQVLRARCRDHIIEVEIVDGGEIEVAENMHDELRGLGLMGLRDRLSSLGGTIEFKSQAGRGSRLTARVPAVVQEHNGV